MKENNFIWGRIRCDFTEHNSSPWVPLFIPAVNFWVHLSKTSSLFGGPVIWSRVIAAVAKNKNNKKEMLYSITNVTFNVCFY